MREAFQRGDAEAALAQHARLPADQQESLEVRELLLAAHLDRLDLPAITFARQLPSILTDLEGAYRRLPEDLPSEADLRMLGDLAFTGTEDAAWQRRTCFALNAATGLLAGLSLHRREAEGGAELCVRAVEYVAAGNPRVSGELVEEAERLLAEWDATGLERAAAVEAMIRGGR